MFTVGVIYVQVCGFANSGFSSFSMNFIVISKTLWKCSCLLLKLWDLHHWNIYRLLCTTKLANCIGWIELEQEFLLVTLVGIWNCYSHILLGCPKCVGMFKWWNEICQRNHSDNGKNRQRIRHNQRHPLLSTDGRWYLGTIE